MQQNGHNKNIEKADKAIDNDNELVLSSLMSDGRKKENNKKIVWFVEDVKQPSKAGMMCTIDGNTFFLFTKNTCIGDSGASCHITKDDRSLYDVIDIDKLIQGSSSIMHAMKKGKL